LRSDLSERMRQRLQSFDEMRAEMRPDLPRRMRQHLLSCGVQL